MSDWRVPKLRDLLAARARRIDAALDALEGENAALAARVAQLPRPRHGGVVPGWLSSNRPGPLAVSTHPCRRCDRPTTRPRWCSECVAVVYQSRTGPVRFTFDQPAALAELPVGVDGVGMG